MKLQGDNSRVRFYRSDVWALWCISSARTSIQTNFLSVVSVYRLSDAWIDDSVYALPLEIYRRGSARKGDSER